MKYIHSGDRIVIACQLCEPPSRKECVGCRRRVNPKFPAKVIWVNNTKYVTDGGNRMSEDKAIHTLYERLKNLLFFQPYGELGRYLTYYAEDRLYLVFDLWYHGIFFVEAKSPKEAIQKVNCDNLNYLPEVEE